tara:strand:+ start:309 stop:521 length:213 start_codon:yes stop_codon:yes gene_type:complete
MGISNKFIIIIYLVVNVVTKTALTLSLILGELAECRVLLNAITLPCLGVIFLKIELSLLNIIVGPLESFK